MCVCVCVQLYYVTHHYDSYIINILDYMIQIAEVTIY